MIERRKCCCCCLRSNSPRMLYDRRQQQQHTALGYGLWAMGFGGGKGGTKGPRWYHPIRYPPAGTPHWYLITREQGGQLCLFPYRACAWNAATSLLYPSLHTQQTGATIVRCRRARTQLGPHVRRKERSNWQQPISLRQSFSKITRVGAVRAVRHPQSH